MNEPQREWAENQLGKKIYGLGIAVDYKSDVAGYGIFLITDEDGEVYREYPAWLRTTPTVEKLRLGFKDRARR